MFIRFWEWMGRNDPARAMSDVSHASTDAANAMSQLAAASKRMSTSAASLAKYTAGASAQSEFSGLGFAAGVLRGARSWNIDDDGFLIEIMRPQRWVTGVNHAVCRRNMMPLFTSTVTGGKITLNIVELAETPEPAPHDMSECGHGFYAYYEGSNDYGRPHRVSGVVEGFGESMIGSRGFRSMKARIAALTFGPDVSAETRDRVLAHYPDVPVFDSFDEMVAAFPPDKGETEPPIEPDEWVREA